MARITKLEQYRWDPRLRAAIRRESLTDLEQGLTRYFAHCPEQALGLMAFGGALKMNRQLPERLVELVRLRIAFFNQCRSCMAIRYSDAVADGVDEALVCSLERPQEAENLTPAEKLAIRYGELMATDHLAIDGHHERMSVTGCASDPAQGIIVAVRRTRPRHPRRELGERRSHRMV